MLERRIKQLTRSWRRAANSDGCISSPADSRRRKRRKFELLEPRHLLTANVVINEIHFDPDDPTEQVEFIELYNDSPDAVDLSNWVLDRAVDFTFDPGSTIDAFGYFVVTQDMAEFQTKFGVAADGQWETSDRLSNDGERIELRDATDQVVDEVDYQLGFPWPTVGAEGASIELIHPSLDNDLAGSWRASTGDSGLPTNPITLLAAQDSNWRYRRGTSEASDPIDAWRFPDFVEDGTWQTGQTSIGYGDGDDNTLLNDMRFNYSSVYLRNTFTIDGEIPSQLLLRVYVDDGAAVWINGQRVGLFHVEDTELAFDDFAFDHDASVFEELTLVGTDQFLTPGENTIAIHVLNSTISSSDLSIDAEVVIPDAGSAIGAPTPGERNSVYDTNAAPQIRQLNQSVQQPTSGEDVIITIKATDPDGVQSVTLDYQLVDPGNYIRLTDAAYETNWTTVTMTDDGTGGDAVAGDSVYSVTLPGSLQTHRRLVRYRITATDMLGVSVTGPYADDPQPNFAYFVYDGVPDYTASLRPGVEPNVTYAGAQLDDIATYHLIANSTDVNNSQYNGSFNLVQFWGTFVYDGVVYDHIEYRNRGRASTYQVGKNKWKINFTRGHAFQARDDYGNRYEVDWDKINILPGTNPWWRNDISTEGTVLYEPVAFRLYELAGTPSPNTQYFQFRVIDDAIETDPNDQYDGDFWGLYIGIEQPDGRFLNERGLPDGSIFNMHSSTFGATSQRTQGSLLPTDRSDLAAFRSGIDGGFETLQWWEENLNFESYFAWNIINHAVNNSDIRPDENVNYYHNQETGQWYIIPWDLDLTFEDRPHLGSSVTNRERIRTVLEDHPTVRIAYENRLREIQDLLLGNNDAALVVEEFANILTLGGGDETIVQANQAQWDFHPRKRKKGIWYDNFNPALLPSETFDGLVTYMQDFVSPGGYGYGLAAGQGDDSGIPDTPTISYVGAAGFPIDGLVFETTPFSDPQGPGSFSALEWRVAEVHNSSVANYDPSQPYIYEIEGTWESGELTTFDSQMAIPGSVLAEGHTYRARVRMQDTTGRWSHWSEAVEFVASAPVDVPSLSITELHYHPFDPNVLDPSTLEFIEILNTGSETIDLSGMQLADFAATPYVFPAATSLGGGEYMVVARDSAAFTAYYGTGINLAVGDFSGSLSNGGETVGLYTSSGVLIQSVAYDDDVPWPTTPDGTGPSLEVIDPLGDPSAGGNWRASFAVGGSPGANGNLPGDYDRSGTVDQLDYGVWRSQFGASVSAGSGADGNGDGRVDVADYTVWRDNLGASVASLAVVTNDEEAADQAPAALVASSFDSLAFPDTGVPQPSALPRHRPSARHSTSSATAVEVDEALSDWDQQTLSQERSEQLELWLRSRHEASDKVSRADAFAEWSVKRPVKSSLTRWNA